jgi:hypothetical protein
VKPFGSVQQLAVGSEHSSEASSSFQVLVVYTFRSIVVQGVAIGSPSGVPVPWTATAATWAAARPARCRAAAISACWEGPLGAVRLLDRPS